MDQVLDVIASICFLLAAMLGLIAAIGMVRLPDLLSRMHAATKPQVLGLVLSLLGLAISLRQPMVLLLLALVALFQGVTTPIASHMVGRASFRAGQVREDLLVIDELSTSLDSDEPRGAP